VGKSSFCSDIAGKIARSGVPTAFFSLEMPGEELVDRYLSNLGPVDYSILQRMEEAELLRDGIIDGIISAYSATEHMPLWIDDQSGLTRDDCRRKLAFAAQKGVRVAFFDYLQLFALPGKQNRAVEIGDISIEMKNFAKEMDMAIVLISQLNRAVESRVVQRPNMSDLRDSGQVEQDADVIIFLSREQDDPDVPIICVDFAKNRQGVRGSLYFEFVGKYQRWIERPDYTPQTQKRAKSGGGF
jgi:replicative DNA helicase